MPAASVKGNGTRESWRGQVARLGGKPWEEMAGGGQTATRGGTPVSSKRETERGKKKGGLAISKNFRC
jgi:hypothetical protein